MNSRIAYSGPSFVLILLAAGCHHEAPPTEARESPRLIDPPPHTLSKEGAPAKKIEPEPGLQAFADLSRRDLADRLGVKTGDLELIEARYVTWPDSSLGCPRPDMQYMQVLTEGTLLVFRHQTQLYEYHGSRRSPPSLCERPGKTPVDQAREATH